MKIEKRAIDSLKPNTWNPNELDDFRKASLAGNIRRFGYLQPILINIDGEIIDGYHRWVAAKEAGLKEVECVVIERPEEERKVLTLAMNNIRGEPNPIELSALLDDLLQEMNVHDLSVMTGYTDKEIEIVIGGVVSEEDLNIEIEGKKVECPNCGYEFALNEVV